MPGLDAPIRPSATALDPYYEGLARGEVLITRCRHCGRAQFPPRAVCSACSSAEPAEWFRASGRGLVWSFGIFHKAYLADFITLPPYNVAVVQLEEGPRLISNIVGVPPAELRVDMPVQAVFEQSDDGTLVKFKQVETAR